MKIYDNRCSRQDTIGSMEVLLLLLIDAFLMTPDF